MPDKPRDKTEKMQQILPRGGTRRSVGTYVRYNWWIVLVHLVLIGFAVVNLYPFIWMVGSSLKTEAEASSEMFSPIPGKKYQLGPQFSLQDVLPVTIKSGLDRESTPTGEDLTDLRQRLLVIDQLQRRMLENNLRSLLSPTRKKWAEQQGDEAQLSEPIETLIDLGLLQRDGASYWLTDTAAAGQNLPEMSEYQKALYTQVRTAQLLTAKGYSISTKQSISESTQDISDLEKLGVFEQVLSAEDPLGPAWQLAPGARHEIYRDMLPRQILTLWSMHDENVRRAESRDVFAANSWKASSYSENYSLASEQRAGEELAELADRGLLEDATVQWMNYWVVLMEENFLLHFLTSTVITVVVVFATVLVSSMLGFALARIQFPGKFLALAAVIAASILPAEARIIPIFKMLLGLGLVDNLWGMVLWLTSFGVGNSLLMAGFFLTLPPEVDEAAEVDGAGTFRKFFDVALPMARPIVMTVGMFAFLTSWNNFLVPLLCTISRPSMQPLAVAVYNFQQGHQGKFHQINAAASLMIVPVILLFLFVQKHVVKSIAVGAVKG
ncbi:MAG: ABC transporter permease subunit [Phycisphaerae bacterium]